MRKHFGQEWGTATPIWVFTPKKQEFLHTRKQMQGWALWHRTYTENQPANQPTNQPR